MRVRVEGVIGLVHIDRDVLVPITDIPIAIGAKTNARAELPAKVGLIVVEAVAFERDLRKADAAADVGTERRVRCEVVPSVAKYLERARVEAAGALAFAIRVGGEVRDLAFNANVRRDVRADNTTENVAGVEAELERAA